MSSSVTRQQLRSFGLIVGGGFAVIGVFPAVIRGHNPRIWALALALVLATAALVLPSALRPVYRLWMQLAEVLAWVNTRIILFLVYYLVIVPTGWVLRITGKDLLRLRLEPRADSYRVVRSKRPATHMQHQY
jgi:hypothetical protein